MVGVFRQATSIYPDLAIFLWPKLAFSGVAQRMSIKHFLQGKCLIQTQYLLLIWQGRNISCFYKSISHARAREFCKGVLTQACSHIRGSNIRKQNKFTEGKFHYGKHYRELEQK